METVTYIVSPHVAEELEQQYSLFQTDLGYVGVLGHKKYGAEVDSPLVLDALRNVTARPLGFVCPKKNCFKYSNILESYILTLTGEKCSGCESQQFEDYTMLYPLIDNDFIYATDDESLRFNINLSDYAKVSLLTPYAMGLDVSSQSGLMHGVKEMNGIVVYDSSMDEYLSFKEMSSRLSIIDSMVDNRKSDGLVIVNRGTYMRDAIVAELTHVWKFRRMESPTRQIYTTKGSVLEGMDGDVFTNWIEQSVHRLMLDLPPLVKVIDNRLVNATDRVTARVILEYMCLRSIRETCLISSEKVEKELTILPSLVALVPVWGPSDLISFLEVFNSIDVNEVRMYPLSDHEEDPLLSDGLLTIVVGNYRVGVLSRSLVDNERAPTADGLVKRKTDWGKYLTVTHQIETVLEETGKGVEEAEDAEEEDAEEEDEEEAEEDAEEEAEDSEVY